jgi:asparagine synthase (glutamine-hydrolysing)
VRKLLLAPDALMYEFLEPETVRRLVEDHLSGRENRRLLLWSLLNFEHWCRTFLGGSVPVEPTALESTVGA